MDKITVIISKIYPDSHTFFVQNIGLDHFTIINKLKNQNDNGFEYINISDEELKLLLNYCVTNCVIEGVYHINNHYNRDQKEINKIKDNIRAKFLSKGLLEVNHCEFNIEYTGDGGDIINKRNYLSILQDDIDLCKQKKEQYINLNRQYDDLQKEYDNYKKRLKDIEVKYQDKEKEFNRLVERYRNGQKCLEEQRKKLPEDIKQLKDSIVLYDDTIIDKKHKITTLNKDIDKLTDEKNRIQKEINAQLDIAEYWKKANNISWVRISDKITDIIMSIKTSEENIDEVKAKFAHNIKMYFLNGKDKIPEFEKEYARRNGLTDKIIEDIIKTINTKL